jgi:hypothetical protein
MFVRLVACGMLAASLLAGAPAQASPPSGERSAEVLDTWYRLILELVRHTPTYSPPVAARAFAYTGVAVWEAVASGDPALVSLAGQLNGLEPLPARETGAAYDEAVILQAALARAGHGFFGNTGPTGQRAMTALGTRLAARAAEGVDPEVVTRSAAHGEAVADHILAWAATDGGAVVENMGFPHEYALSDAPGSWVPTSLIAQQQLPLLPGWGEVRTLAMPDGRTCDLPPPPAYSEEAASEFHAEALEVWETSRSLTEDQRLAARFWSDDPMLSPTPPGHWISIARRILAAQDAPLDRQAEVLALLGIAMSDSFVACWHTKFRYDLLRPVTYINRHIDADWQPLLITPPFPEYPSGHSTQSGAAATVLTALFGEGFAFEDATHVDDGLPVRAFPDFWAAAEEAALSRLYGGIHFRAAIERGLEQGRCVGTHTAALRTRS